MRNGLRVRFARGDLSGLGGHSCGRPFGPSRITEIWQHQGSWFGPNGQLPEGSHLARIPSMIILGLNAFHGDSAAALVRDGELVAAAEEERFRRVKHWAGFPSKAIAYCLREAGLALSDVQHVAVNQDSRANRLRKLAYLVTQRPKLGLMLNRLKNRRARGNISELMAGSFSGQHLHGQVHQIEHHLAHLSSAFHVSPFKEAVVLSVDGFGDFSSAAWGVGNGKDVQGHGPCALRQAGIHGCDAQNRAAQARWRIGTRSRLFSPS